MEQKTQNEAILSALLAGDTLTPLDALRRFGCFRLGARIWDLKERGHNITMEMVSANGKRFASYRLATTQLALRL